MSNNRVIDYFREKLGIYIVIDPITTPNEILGFEIRLKSWRFSPILVEYNRTDYKIAEDLAIEEVCKILDKYK